MNTCAKCGEPLDWQESHTVFWNSQLKKGHITWRVIGSAQFGKRKDLPHFTGKKICQSCAFELFNFGDVCPECGKRGPHKCSPNADKKLCSKCAFVSKTIVEIERGPEKMNFMGLITGAKDMDKSSVDKWACTKNFDMKNQVKFAETCSSYRKQTEEEKNRLEEQAQTVSEPVEAVADFSALKEELTKDGVVMSAFNCPKCSGMVDLPENGKILICKHCGNPIKPADILEKIKPLIE
jgi:hypothetical protein